MQKTTSLPGIKLFTLIICIIFLCVSCSSAGTPDQLAISPSGTVMPFTMTPDKTITPNKDLTATADWARFQITLDALRTQVSKAGAISTPIPTQVITPVPTLSEESTNQFILNRFADNGGCKFPCWWGITPGISKSSDAYSMLSQLSLASVSIGLSPTEGDISLNYPAKEVRIRFSIDYFPDTKQNSLQTIYISTQALQMIGNDSWKAAYDSKEYKDLLQKYTLPSILSEYGKPSKIWLGAFVIPFGAEGPTPKSVSRVTLLYPERGLFIRYTNEFERNGNKAFFCPNQSFVDVWLLPPQAKNLYQEILSSFSIDWEGSPTKVGVMPLEDASQMTIENFYQTYKNPTEKCIQTPEGIWPTP
jgi:hypothetical protein